MLSEAMREDSREEGGMKLRRMSGKDKYIPWDWAGQFSTGRSSGTGHLPALGKARGRGKRLTVWRIGDGSGRYSTRNMDRRAEWGGLSLGASTSSAEGVSYGHVWVRNVPELDLPVI